MREVDWIVAASPPPIPPIEVCSEMIRPFSVETSVVKIPFCVANVARSVANVTRSAANVVRYPLMDELFEAAFVLLVAIEDKYPEKVERSVASVESEVANAEFCPV